MGGTNTSSVNFDFKNGIGIEDQPKQTPQFFSGITFHNNLNVTIYIGTREGFIYELKPLNARDVREFVYIQREYSHMSSNAKLIRHMEHPNGLSGLLQGVVHQANYGSAHATHTSIKVFNTLEYKDLVDVDALYFEDIDYVISLKPDGWLHPNIQSKLHDPYTKDFDGQETSIKFELVDYNNFYGDSFINVNGSVHKVVATNKRNRTEGLYIYFNSVMKDGQYRSSDLAYIPLNKIIDSSWRLHPSYQDAAILGDYKHQREELKQQLREKREEEILQLKHEVELAKQENVRIKEEHRKKEAEDDMRKSKAEADLLEAKRILAAEQDRWSREKAELVHQHNMERSKLEHQLELRALDRKDSSETLKWVLGIVSTLFSLAAMFMSRSKD